LPAAEPDWTTTASGVSNNRDVAAS
jgi:hypothetical protein